MAALFAADERPAREVARLLRLMDLFAALPPPPDPLGLWPDAAVLRERFLAAAATAPAEEVEEAFLALYCHVHGHEAPYTPAERRRMDQLGGYWCHAGGLSPLVKAGEHIGPATVSGDLGAGNGLQCLLLQRLYPHARTVQVELSSRMVEGGRVLQEWLGVDRDRVAWVVGDVLEHGARGLDFVYLYRPVRPEGAGRAFYERLAADLDAAAPGVVVFSVADALRPFLGAEFEVLHHDGHLTCFRKRGPDAAPASPVA